MGNGQCVAARRSVLIGAGGWRGVAHHSVEDVALVRAMATAGFSVAFLDAADLLTVRMYESATEAWSGWGRSLSLPGVEPSLRRFAGLGIVTLAQAAPLLRLLARRGDVLDVALLAVRLGVLVGTARRLSTPGRRLLAVTDRRPRCCGSDRTELAHADASLARALLSRDAIQKRIPMNDISAPVAAVRRVPSTASWTSG